MLKPPECFRRRVLKFYLRGNLISQDMVDNLLRAVTTVSSVIAHLSLHHPRSNQPWVLLSLHVEQEGIWRGQG